MRATALDRSTARALALLSAALATDPPARPHRSTVTVRFETRAHAELAARSLSVDDDLQPGRAVKTFRVDGENLVVDLSAADARLLRVITLSLFDMIAVVVRTLREFS